MRFVTVYQVGEGKLVEEKMDSTTLKALAQDRHVVRNETDQNP